LLEEEHCLRSQVMDLCSLKEKMADQDQLKFEAGSIETLLNLVEMMKGITIIPELATIDFSTIRKNGVRQFADPVPSREIGLITYRPFVKENLIDILENEIKNAMQHVITSC
jgi:LysR family hydrogen peroxide-inducible transcriptional activator